MAEEVGVLNLTIHDNSEQAGQGLQSLADALSRVKRVVKNIDLSPVGQQVVALAKTIKEARGTSTIVKNLGTMFNAINKFSSIKKFTIDTEQIKDTAQNLLKLAEAKEKVDEAAKTSVATGDWRSGMSTIADDTKKAVAEVDKSIDGFKETMDRAKEIAGNTGDLWSAFMRMGAFSTARPGGKQVAGQISMDLDNLLKETKSEIQSKTGDFQEIGERAGRQIATGLTLTKEDIANSSGLIGDFMKQSLYTSLKTEDIMDKPLEYLHDIFRTTTASMKDYESGVGAVLPKVQELSSEEMLLAGNAKRAAEAMEVSNKLFSNLEKPIDYSNLTKYTEVITGVTDRVKKLAQDSAGIFAVPALDQSGPFKYAAEEVQHYTDLLNKARSDMEFWDQKYTETMKRIKYNGATEERTNMLGHAEEGFSQAVARMEEYDAVLVRINEHIANYQENSKGIGSIQGIYENSIAGPLLAGLQGAEAQAMMIQAVSRETGLSIEEIKRQITELSNGAVQFEDAANKVNEATEAAADGGVNELNRQLRETASAADPVISKIELLRNKVNHYWSRISKLSLQPAVDAAGKDTGRDNAINEYLLKILKVNDEINKLIENAHKAQDALQFDALVANADNRQRDYGMETVDNMVNQYSEIDLLTMKMDGLKQALADDINQNKVDTQQIAERVMAIQNLKEKIDELVESEEKAARSSTILGDAFNSLKSGIQKMFPTITGLLKRFKNMMVMRAMRYVIRQIGAGLSEGLENVYWYSKAVGTEFAPAMDSAATALAQMKNSIGAALAPVLQALIPVLQTIVNWFINLINYANQFFALLNGQSSWTKALETPISAFEDKTKKAKKAAKEAKDLLADWDELNIIQSKSGGTGTGNTTPGTDYTKMFEQVNEYSKTIKALVDGIKKNFGSILDFAKKIGLAMIGWKMASSLTGILGTLGGLLAAGEIITINFKLTSMFDEQYLKTGDIGWFVADVLTTALGTFLTYSVIKKVLGTGAGEVAAGINLVVNAVADIQAMIGAKDVDALSEENILHTIKTSAKLGAGMFFFSHAAGLGVGTSLLAGGELASIAIGVLLGVKATAEAIESEEVSFDHVKTVAAGAVASGLGVTVFELLNGATFGAAIATGGAAALWIAAGFAVALAVVATINMSKQRIVWGKEELTDEDITTWVNSQRAFTVDVKTTANLVKGKIELLPKDRTALETDMATALGTFKVIQLGIATTQDYETMHSELDTVLDDIHTYVTDAKNLGKLTITLFPQLSTTGTNGTESDLTSWFGSYKEGWDLVDKWATDTGNRIGDLLVKAEAGTITDSESKVLEALMNQMENVTSVMTRSKINAEAYSKLKFSVGDMSELTKASMGKVASAFGEYRSELVDSYKQLAIEQLIVQEQLVDELALIAPDSEAYKNAVAKRDWLRENLELWADAAAKQASSPGTREIVKTLGEKYKERLLKDTTFENPFTDYFKELYGTTETDARQISEGINEWLLGEYGPLSVAGLTELQDFIKTAGFSAFHVLPNEVKANIYNWMRNAYGDSVADAIMEYLNLEITDPATGKTNISPDDLITYSLISSADTAQKALENIVKESIPESTSEPVEIPVTTKPVVDEDAKNEALEKIEIEKSDITIDKVTVDIGEVSLSDDAKSKIKYVDGIAFDNVPLATTNEYDPTRQAATHFSLEAFRDLSQYLGDVLKFQFNPEFGGTDTFKNGYTFDASLERFVEQLNSGSALPTALGYRAAAGASLAGYSSNPSYTENSEENNEQEISNMAQGVQRGNTDVVSALLQLIDVANAINRKDFTVNLNASAGLGALMNRSLSSLGKVTGD